MAISYVKNKEQLICNCNKNLASKKVGLYTYLHNDDGYDSNNNKEKKCHYTLVSCNLIEKIKTKSKKLGIQKTNNIIFQ